VRPGGWWELFSSIAETHILSRALGRVSSPGEHAVFVELVPYGSGRTFLAGMLGAYAGARGEIDALAWAAGGEIVEDEGKVGVARAIDARAEVVVLKIVGLCIKDYLGLETGTHVWQPSVHEPELLRVRVLAADINTTPAAHVKEYLAARERADREGTPADQHPDRLLPVVRTIRFDPPAPQKPAALLEMEDFVLGMPYSTRVTTLADAFATLWLLRMSRVEESGNNDEGAQP
jgi:ATP-dependent Clp protease ATP-binding subunit ClpA/ATP-dependent Clp protease ATP-binding subunit ClpC